MAKGINWRINSNIKLRINNLEKPKIIKVKGNPKEAFDLNFVANVILPNHIGLGQNTSVGFGKINRIKN
jgi:hypothetical protein